MNLSGLSSSQVRGVSMSLKKKPKSNKMTKPSEGYLLAKRQMQEALDYRINDLEVDECLICLSTQLGGWVHGSAKMFL